MLPRRIANRYAQALFSLALEQQKVDAWEGELATLASVLERSPDLRQVLTHPEIPLGRKIEVLQQVFQGKLAPEILALLRKLVQRGHAPDIDTIHELYVARWNAVRQVIPATVTSAIPLTETQVQSLTTALMRRTGATVQLSRQVNPDLIAGMIIMIGDRVIDASARGALTALRESTVGA